MTTYSRWFEGSTGRLPYDWQERLAAADGCGDRLIRVPTGFGKTLGAWLYHRVILDDDRWPRRLLWTLPMRVLVEQTEAEVNQVLASLGLAWDGTGPHQGRVGVHALMGGTDAGEWHLHPEAPAVLIGTQDMLLSRGLNRGYGAARARWPTDFGLVSQDVLWVLDEVQLMDVGLATAAQLAAFRLQSAPKAQRPAFTWAMSATLQRNWLTRSPDTGAWVDGLSDVALGATDQATDLWSTTTKPIALLEPLPARALASLIDTRHRALPGGTPLTLVVVNTVDRARELYQEVRRSAPAEVGVHLIHSRFRGVERARWRDELLGPDAPKASRIVIATQVIEAGVDLSADAMFTELCPWPSLIQRLGRLARRGGSGPAVIIGLDTAKAAAPYAAADLDAAWDALGRLPDGSPRALADFESATENVPLLPGLYPYDPEHLLLREELDELFDTTPDLTGADLDVSRYIRSGEERDVSVFWVATPPTQRGRVEAPDPKLRPVRDGLCTVPFLRARDWLFGKKQGGVDPKRLREGVNAWVWDYLDGRWRTAVRQDVWPGQVVLVDAAVGGYEPELGWDPAAKKPFPLVAPETASRQEQADAGQDQEELSEARWQTIAFHGRAVAEEVDRIAAGVVPVPLVRLLRLAARWHDVGKAHPAFQGAIGGPERPDRSDLAKAPRSAWRKGRDLYRISAHEVRRGFRHELASTLALFAVISRHAPAEHPSRLGALAVIFETEPLAGPSDPGPLEAEILQLSAEDFDLVAYLVCSHHGKLRSRLHGSPADQAAAVSGGAMPIRGVYTGDRLPDVALVDGDGQHRILPSVTLDLEPASLGLSARTGRSWTERTEALLKRHGPFTLAWLEAVLRAADVRASKDATLADSTLSPQVAPCV